MQTLHPRPVAWARAAATPGSLPVGTVAWEAALLSCLPSLPGYPGLHVSDPTNTHALLSGLEPLPVITAQSQQWQNRSPEQLKGSLSRIHAGIVGLHPCPALDLGPFSCHHLCQDPLGFLSLPRHAAPTRKALPWAQPEREHLAWALDPPCLE